MWALEDVILGKKVVVAVRSTSGVDARPPANLSERHSLPTTRLRIVLTVDRGEIDGRHEVLRRHTMMRMRGRNDADNS